MMVMMHMTIGNIIMILIMQCKQSCNVQMKKNIMKMTMEMSLGRSLMMVMMKNLLVMMMIENGWKDLPNGRERQSCLSGPKEGMK